MLSGARPRACSPEDTIQKIEKGLEKFGLSPFVRMGRSCATEGDDLYWCVLFHIINNQSKSLLEQKKETVMRLTSSFLEGMYLQPEHVTGRQYNFAFASSGKGASAILAKASGLAELAERYQSDLFYKEPNSNKQIELSEFIPSDKICIYDVFKDDKIFGIQTDAFSLSREEYFRVPIEIIEFTNASNGLAAGNTIEEAIIQASMEVFERAAVIKACSEKKIVPNYDLALITNSKILEIIDALKMNGIDVMIKDLSYGIFPTVGVVLYNKNLEGDSNPFKRDRIFTLEAASSFSFEEAIMRCFTECFQGRTLNEIRKRSLEDITLKNFQLTFLNIDYSPPPTWFFQFRFRIALQDISHLFVEKEIIKEIPKTFAPELSILDEISNIRSIANKLGSDVLVVDLTNEIINFPTVRVIIPMVSDAIKFDYSHHPFFDPLQPGKWRNASIYRYLLNLTRETAKFYIDRISTSSDEYNNLSSLDLIAIRRLLFHHTFYKTVQWSEVYDDPPLKNRIIYFLNKAAR